MRWAMMWQRNLLKQSETAVESPPAKKPRGLCEPDLEQQSADDKRWDSWAPDSEPWESDTFDVKKWKGVLEEYGVDGAGRHSLWLLAQLPYYGEAEANHIIAKLVKKHSDGVYVSNPSGFVHSSCLNARQRLQHRGLL